MLSILPNKRQCPHYCLPSQAIERKRASGEDAPETEADFERLLAGGGGGALSFSIKSY